MAFGRKKKSADVSNAPVSAEEPRTKRSAQKKRKPAELLSSVIQETTVGPAVDLMKRNEAFALPNGTSWVGLLLSADNIGGLSQKHKSDAAKGSIVELISADKIQVVATKAMLDEEFLGIIPSGETLDRMDEFHLLTDAPYHWVVFRTDDSGQSLLADHVKDVDASYAQALAISRGETSIAEVLPHVWSWGGGSSIAEPVLEERAEFDRILKGEPALVGAGASAGVASGSYSEDLADPLAGALIEEELPEIDYSTLDDDVTVDDMVDTEPELEFDAAQFEAQFTEAPSTFEHDATVDPTWDDTPASGHVDDVAQTDDAYTQYLVENRDRVVSEEEVRDTIVRRFLSDDLDLVVDLDEFEKVFGSGAETIELSIADDASDWLGSQIAQLSRQANAELAQLHLTHTEELRQLFVETMALHIEKTMSVVSTDAPGGQYAALMDGAKRDFELQRENSTPAISQRRKEIVERFEAAAQSRAEQAAAHARSVYEDKNRPKLERDLAEVALDHDRRLEEQFAHDRQTVLEMRRKEANVRMDLGTNRVFEHLRGVHAEQRAAEQSLLQEWNSRLLAFVDENRKNDIARAMVLADELARTNKVEDLERKHAEQMVAAREEHRQREERLQLELIRSRQEAVDELSRRRADYDTSIQVEKQRNEAGASLLSQLQVQLDGLEGKYEAKYQSRISTLEADKKAAEQAGKRAEKAHRASNRMMAVLLATLTVAGIAIGVIAGWGWAQAQNADSASTQVSVVETLV